ncbi:MAG: ATP-binding protein [Ilumatobacteraceae bacterium]|nr:ATP-binding protein [Ilumatobacteraceae bacterium]
MPDVLLGGAPDAPTTIDTGDLTTHGVIVGMTGSGKTGLGVVLIEEILRSGLPVLAIDPKGDLTNLCLTFPGLAAADFRPWVDESQAAAAGVSADEFAGQQATMWRDGLAGWGLDGASIEELRSTAPVTIYTPGSTAGVPLNIVGSLRAPDDLTDSELVNDEIDGYVSGLLGLVGVDADPLASREHILLSNLIAHSWTAGQTIDLTALVGMVAAPPIRKLGVFELDQFFPPDDRMAFAMRLNGLLASPAFAEWSTGEPLDIESLLYDSTGGPRCAVITTAHLGDDERQFVTSLLLSKLITWMRRQSGVTDLRALLYMDEVAGYLPPTAKPPTKGPILTLMKQARAFGVGVVLSTQNPVDVDYKALSNAGTWMIGRLQTEQDIDRLLDGMTSAAGTVDRSAVADSIAGLGKRAFVLRRAKSDEPTTFSTRWAMSYLRGPLTRDQIHRLMGDRTTTARGASAGASASSPPSAPASSPTAPPPTAPPTAAGEHAEMPPVADGRMVAFIDVAAPWLSSLDHVDADATGQQWAAAAVARVSVRYDETKADLVHDTEFEAVLAPLPTVIDTVAIERALIAVDYDDRDLRPAADRARTFFAPEAPIDTKSYWQKLERSLRDHLTAKLSIEIPANSELQLYGRPGESTDDFAKRCRDAAADQADVAIAKLRDRYEKKVTTLRDRIDAAEDRVEVLEAEASSKRNSELLSTAGSLLGGLLSGRRSVDRLLGDAGTAARRRGSSSAGGKRVDAAENKVDRLTEDLAELEADLADDIDEVRTKWDDAASAITSIEVGVERADVKVTRLALGWVPVA